MVPKRTLIPASILGTIYAILLPLLYRLVLYLSEQDCLLLCSIIISLVTYTIFSSLIFIYRTTALKHRGPIPIPIFGNSPSLIEQGLLADSVEHLIRRYGPVLDLLLMDGDTVTIIHDAAACKNVMMKSSDRGDLSDDFPNRFRERLLWKDIHAYSSIDLFASTNQNWRKLRKLMQPAFDQARVRSMSESIIHSIHEFLKRLSKKATQEVFDILPSLQHHGLHMIGQTSLGLSLEEVDKYGPFLIETMHKTQVLFGSYLCDPMPFLSFYVMPYLGLNPMELEHKKSNLRFRDFVRNLYQKERAKQKKEGKSGEMDNLLSILVNISINDPAFTEGKAIDNISSFMFAGYDTTSVTLANFLYYIGKHPGVQTKVQKEIDTTKSLSEALSIRSLPYLSASIRESQRLQPVSHVLQRRVAEPVPIKSTGQTIERGEVVFVPVCMLHRDPHIYPAPNEFKPERWLGETGELMPVLPGYFYAFGAGPKMCIGYQLAEKEVKLTAAGILGNFEVATEGLLDIEDNFVTGPSGVHVKLTKRR